MQGPLRQNLKVFLCHSSADMEAARKLYNRLQGEGGFEPWLDQESLVPGQNWREEIPRAVNSCDVFLVCLSSTSVTKEGYLQREIRYALDVAEEKPEEAIFIIPVKLEECEIPTRLREWQWANLYQENGYEKLIRALRLRTESLAANEVTPQMFSAGAKAAAPVRAVEQQVPEMPSQAVEAVITSPLNPSRKASAPAATQVDVNRGISAENPKKISFANLIGVSPELVDWPKLWLFVASYLLSFIFSALARIYTFNFEFLFVNLLFVLSVLLAFYKVRSTAGALVLAAMTYTLVRNLMRGILFHQEYELQAMSLASSFSWAAFYLAGLCYGVQFIRPLWAGLSLGALAGSFLAIFAASALAHFVPPLSLYLQDLLSEILFLLIFLSGFYLLQKYRSKHRLMRP